VAWWLANQLTRSEEEVEEEKKLLILYKYHPLDDDDAFDYATLLHHITLYKK